MEQSFDQWLIERVKKGDTSIVGRLPTFFSDHCAEKGLSQKEEINRIILEYRDASPNTNLANQVFDELEAIFLDHHRK